MLASVSLDRPNGDVNAIDFPRLDGLQSPLPQVSYAYDYETSGGTVYCGVGFYKSVMYGIFLCLNFVFLIVDIVSFCVLIQNL